MKNITCVEDLRRLAMRRASRAIFDYVDRGSYSEDTIRANSADLARLRLRQRVMVDVSLRSLSTTMLGEPVSMPVAIAPTGLTGLMHGDGEILGCRAAHAAGIPFTLSTMSICSIEDVAGAVAKPFWFQLYMMKDRGFVKSLIERAIAAKCSALMLTLDLQIQGQRHQDIKNGLAVPPRLTLNNLIDIACKPRWAAGVLMGKRKTFGNLQGWMPAGNTVGTLSQWIAGQFDTSLNWKDVEWIRSQWPGKLIMKGVLDADDAKMAAKCGAQAIVVSNHGGRQLDGAASSIASLPRVLDAINKNTESGKDAEVWFDSGIRSGQDVLRALALGAQATMIGKSWLYGLGAGGEAGVTKVLEILRKELDISMALTGTNDVRNVDRSTLDTVG
jgi:L-lactate dehydrogenase (cytochrome)